MNKHFFATIQYDGSAFFGYQIQPKERTIQSVLENILKRFFNQEIKVRAAGRTDKGVHAYGQAISFSATTHIATDRIIKSLNKMLPDDVQINSLETKEIDARYAKSRSYLYKIKNISEKNAFNSKYYCFHESIDLKEFKNKLSLFVGTHDFKYFSTKVPTYYNTVKTIYEICLKEENNTIYIQIKGDAFLRGMVRSILGACIYMDIEFIKIALKNQTNARKKRVPAEGLYFLKAEY